MSISVPFAMRSERSANGSHGKDTQSYTKLSVKLDDFQTKHKRPILFIVPARTSPKLNYAIHGKNRDLFGLKDHSDGILALYYHHKVNISDKPVIHHVRVTGQKDRQARHNQGNDKVLNMKIRITISKSE